MDILNGNDETLSPNDFLPSECGRGVGTVRIEY